MSGRVPAFRHRYRLVTALYGVAITVALLTRVAGAAGETSIRGFWLPRAALDSPESIRRALTTIQSTTYDTVFVPMSAVDSDAHPEFDGTGEFVKDARERGLHVHAWIDVNRVADSDEFPASRSNVIYQHPEWLMLPRALAPEMLTMDPRGPAYLGRLSRWTRSNRSRVDGLYLSPLDPDASMYLTSVITSAIRRYGVEGVFLDAVRFPGNDFDYSRHAMDLFRADIRPRLTPSERSRLDEVEAIDPFGYASEFPNEWSAFRQARLTALVTRLHASLKSINPQLTVTLNTASDDNVARDEQFQEWREWVVNRLIDGVGQRTGNDATVVLSPDVLIPRPVAPPATGQALVGGSR